jgi:phosphoserine phosphatase RsbU/P
VGVMPNSKFHSKHVSVPHNARLYLYSDGAYEVTTPQGVMLQLEDLQAIIARVAMNDGPQTAGILKVVREAHGKAELQDDVSLLEVTFD